MTPRYQIKTRSEYYKDWNKQETKSNENTENMAIHQIVPMPNNKPVIPQTCYTYYTLSPQEQYT